jgi:hypothetical protein
MISFNNHLNLNFVALMNLGALQKLEKTIFSTCSANGALPDSKAV